MPRLGALALTLLLSAGCATAPRAKQTPSQHLRATVEAFFDDWLQLNPVQATLLGDHRFDAQLGDPASLEHLRATKTLHQTWADAARRIDRGGLNAEERLQLDVFLHEREVGLEALRYPDHLMPLNQMSGLPTTLARLGSGDGAQPFHTAAQHDAWISRAHGFPRWVDSAIDRMREGAARGITPPRVVMEKVVAQLDALAEPAVEKSVFAGPVKRLGALPAEHQERLLIAYATLITEVLAPSMTKLRDFVRDEYLPACRTTTGWTQLPDGPAWYAFKVREKTTTALSPEDIHAVGEAEVARILSEMQRVRAQVGFEGDLPAFFTHLRDDPASYFTRPEDLLEGYRNLKQRIDAALPRLFSLFPGTDYEVRAVEAFRAESAPAAEYRNPPGDGSQPGIFYVNTFNLKAQPKWGMETLSLHEAAPGHHFQTALQQEQPDAPRFRRFAAYTAYDEGWALYAESLGKELGLFTEPMSWFGRLNDEQLRAMRLVVDTGLHSKGWSREQARDFMAANSSLALTDINAEVDRYLVWPGQALGYKVGQLKLAWLRKKARDRLGPRFDVRAFHALVLRGGPLPLDVLEAQVDRWVAQQAAR